MHSIARIVEGFGRELVELIVFLVSDLGLLLSPDRLDRIDAIFTNENGKGNKVGIGLKDLLHTPVSSEFLGVLRAA